MSFLATAIGSGVLLVITAALFVVEDRKGVRFGERIRVLFDRSLEASLRTLSHHTPTINSRFFRQIFHFVTHHVLRAVLVVTKKLEMYLSKAVSLNRKRARIVNTEAPKHTSDHLTEIAAYKESAQLTEREKKTRRDKALRGE